MADMRTLTDKLFTETRENGVLSVTPLQKRFVCSMRIKILEIVL